MDEKSIAYLEKIRQRYRFTEHKNLSDMKLLRKVHSERILGLIGMTLLIPVCIHNFRMNNVDTPTIVIAFVFAIALVASFIAHIVYYRRVSRLRNQLEDALCGDGNYIVKHTE